MTPQQTSLSVQGSAPPIQILGAGSWGTTLAIHLARGKVPVRLWARDPEDRTRLARDRENTKYLPGFPFPDFLQVLDEDDPGPTMTRVVAAPSHAVRDLVRARGASSARTWILATKGLEEQTGLRMSQVLVEEGVPPEGAVVLAGPSLAREVAARQPTALLSACVDVERAREVQQLFSSDRFRVYTTTDVCGVEFATALKNVVALAAGIAAGQELGANALGALVTRGLAEITRLGVSQGACLETFRGLAGVGDLVTTCTSSLSRNHSLGEAIGRGETLEQALQAMTMVAEGVRTTRAAVQLARRVGVEVPIAEQVHRILFEDADVREALHELMTRPLKEE